MNKLWCVPMVGCTEPKMPSRPQERHILKGDLTRVTSRSHLSQWRGEGVVSEGGSVVLMERLKRGKQVAVGDVTCGNRRSSSPKRQIKNRKASQVGYLRSLIQDLNWAFRELGGPEQSLLNIERIAIFIELSLSQESRLYHDVQHVYQISAGATALQVLSAFFRDVVKESIDKPTLDQTRDIMKGYFLEGGFTISPDLKDPHDLLVAQIFGYKPGNDLTEILGWHKGMDMFLSAIVAVRILKDSLPLKRLGQICACIEATIPFREKVKGQPTPLKVLYSRLEQSNTDFALELSKEELVSTIQQACDFWNRQLGNMVSSDPAVFLDHTWSLMPELHQGLQNRNLYTVNEFHDAMVSMHKFLTGLQADKLYLQYHNIPSMHEIKPFQQCFRSNRAVAISYVTARLVAVAVIASFACKTGGDGPKSYFFGDLPALHRQSVNLGELLDIPASANSAASCDMEVYDLLASGERRLVDAWFDIRNTGIAAFLYSNLGEDNLPRALELSQQSPMTPESSMKLLTWLPLDVVKPILRAFAFMAKTRAPQAEKLLTELQSAEMRIREQPPKDKDWRDQRMQTRAAWRGPLGRVLLAIKRRRQKRDQPGTQAQRFRDTPASI